MNKQKSPYVNRTIEEVNRLELNRFYIQLGSEVYLAESGNVSFTKDKSEEIFFDILEDLYDMKKNGTKIQKVDASACLHYFKIHPLRFH